jgi:hypothetical protein
MHAYHDITTSDATDIARMTRLIAARVNAPRMRGRAALLRRARAGDDTALAALECGDLSILDRDPLVAHLRRGGTIPAARCSSAQARGKAARYSYWGATSYVIRWSEDSMRAVAVAESRATSARRSHRLAIEDTCALAKERGGIVIESTGALSQADLDRARAWCLEHSP